MPQINDIEREIFIIVIVTSHDRKHYLRIE